MARNLLAAGYTVVGYDTNAASARAAGADGIALANDAAEVAVYVVLEAMRRLVR